MGETLYTQAGIIRFYDGTVIAIEQQEYSPDGITNWEPTFNPDDHLSSLDGVTPIAGHKYKRVMHSGDISWQMPYKIVAETPEFRVTATEPRELQWKFEDETIWKHLFYLSEVKGDDGEQGEQGIPGEGFHIDLYGFYQARPDCTESLSSTCNSCNRAATGSSQATTFMSLGDGVMVFTTTIIAATSVDVDSVTYSYFSHDKITWTAISAAIPDLEARYLAVDALGATWTDMQTEDYYGTRGLVYICAEGNWTILTNVATPSYMVGEAVASTNIGFLDNFVTSSANTLTGSIALNAGLFEIIEQTVTENAFIQTAFGDGLEIPSPMDKPQVAATDFGGFGLLAYTSDADSLIDLQVDASVLLGDGIAAQAAVAVDGETRNLFQVNASDLINNDSGITAVAQGDTFEDFMINLGNGLILDGGAPQAITIDVDPDTLTVDATSLRLTPYGGGSTGVSLVHLNPDIIWANRGLALDTGNGLTTRVDGATIGWDGTGQLEIPVNGLTGDRLNDDTADNTKGIEVLNDMLAVKVDGSTIGFDGSGQLEYIGALGTQVISIIPVVNSFVLTSANDDVTWNFNDGTGILMTMTSAADVITTSAAIDTAWLDTYITTNFPTGSPTWGTIIGTVTDQSDLVVYITSLSHLVEDTYYGGKAKINDTDGLILKAASGEEYYVIVDAEGNLDTLAV